MKMQKFLFGVALTFVFATSSNAAELLLTEVSGKSGKVVGLDVVSDDRVVAFQANLSVSNLGKNKPDLSKCLSKLPSTHTGSCSITKTGEVLVVVYSMSNASLGSGIFSIGHLSLGDKAGVSVREFLVSDAKGNALDSKHSVQ
jgi:hypothetical protein